MYRLKHFGKYVIKDKCQENIGICILKSQKYDKIADATQKPDILNNHFKSVFTTEDMSCIPDKDTSPIYTSIPGINSALNAMRNFLSNCDTNKSAVPDNIHAAFLKHVACEVALISTSLFKQSFNKKWHSAFFMEASLCYPNIQER